MSLSQGKEPASYPDVSLLMKMCAQSKAGRRQRARSGRRFACRLYPSHGPLRFITSHSFRARLCHAKNEAPEEEAGKEQRASTNKYRKGQNNEISMKVGPGEGMHSVKSRHPNVHAVTHFLVANFNYVGS